MYKGEADVDAACRDVQTELVEKRGDPTGLSPESGEHFSECHDCGAVADKERSLFGLFQEAIPETDLEGSVMSSIARGRRARKAA